MSAEATNYERGGDSHGRHWVSFPTEASRAHICFPGNVGDDSDSLSRSAAAQSGTVRGRCPRPPRRRAARSSPPTPGGRARGQPLHNGAHKGRQFETSERNHPNGDGQDLDDLGGEDAELSAALPPEMADCSSRSVPKTWKWDSCCTLKVSPDIGFKQCLGFRVTSRQH